MRPRITARPSLFALVCLPLLAALLLPGCGGHEAVVAKVGDKQITVADYEAALGRLARENLPRDDDGQVIDTSTLDGKKRFLDILVDKELLALKARELGFDADQQVAGFRKDFTGYKATEVMHHELIEVPASQVTEDEIQAYYDRLKQKRQFHFLICNFRDDALKAREKLLAGASWDEVAEEFNVGSRGPNGDYTFTMVYGQQDKVFEDALFNLEPGQISEPLQNMYGYWIARLDKVLPNDVPPLDDQFREKIRRSVAAHKKKHLEDQFIAASRKKHEFKMDETSLWIIYQGLPEHEAYLDSVTRKPIPKEQLQPLDIPLEDMDRFFMSCRFDLNKPEPDTWTIGDYKALFDNMSTFARPKKERLLGGVRNKILHDMIDRRLFVSEARERGYFDDPRVTGESQRRVEEMMITKLHDELVKVDEQVSEAAIDSFWQEHKDEYHQPEERQGHIIYCPEQQIAAKALKDARRGKDWPSLLRAYGIKLIGSKADGSFTLKATDDDTPEKKTLFSLAKAGDLSEPFTAQGKWAVIRLDKIMPERRPTLEQVRDAVAKRIVAARKDKLFRQLLDQWRRDYGVTVNEQALARVRSWEELHAAAGGQGPDEAKGKA